MDIENKATRIRLFNFSTPQMRAFHMSWFSFFLCFFAWFGIAPLMAVVRDELGLTKTQIGNTINCIRCNYHFGSFVYWMVM